MRRVIAAGAALVVLAAPLFVAAPASAEAPVIPLSRSTFVDGTFLPTIEVSFNGSAPYRMLLDTGSNIVVLFPTALPVTVPPITVTTTPHKAPYTGTEVEGFIALATVSVEDSLGTTIATPTPIPFLYGDACTPPDHCLGAGATPEIHGIFGIGQGLAPVPSVPAGTTYDLYSALAQLGGETAQGFTVELTESGGTLELGPPTIGPSDAVLQQTAMSTAYPNGLPQHQKRVPMCMQIEVGQSCLGTTVDSGERTSSVMGDQFTQGITHTTPPSTPPVGVQILKAGEVDPGVPIGLSPPGGGQPFAQWFAGAAPYGATFFVPVPATPPNPAFLNTGNQLFLGRSIGFDLMNGAVIIGLLTAAPSAPSGLAISVSGTAIDARWIAPDGAHDGFLVTVRGSDGSLRTIQTVGTAVTIPALAAGVTYSVGVAAFDGVLVGPQAATSIATLAATGTDYRWMPWVAIAALVAALGGILLLRLGMERTARRL